VYRERERRRRLHAARTGETMPQTTVQSMHAALRAARCGADARAKRTAAGLAGPGDDDDDDEDETPIGDPDEDEGYDDEDDDEEEDTLWACAP
jgi:hypothetical protein